jgi:hypothetical protein
MASGTGNEACIDAPAGHLGSPLRIIPNIDPGMLARPSDKPLSKRFSPQDF